MTTREFKKTRDEVLDHLEYVKDNSYKIYDNLELQNKYQNIDKNNKEKIDFYFKNAKNSYDEKTKNIINVLEKKKDVKSVHLDHLKSGRYDLDKVFIENVDKNEKLNEEILNKDKIILLNEYYVQKKNNWISALTSLLIYLILMIIPFYVTEGNFISKLYGYSFILLSLLITIIVILARNYNKDGSGVRKIIKKTEETAKDFTKDVIKGIFPDDFLTKCPKEEEEKEKPELPEYNYKEGNEVSYRSGQNMFEDGDIPEIGGTLDGYKALGEEVEPKPFYGEDKRTKSYTCRWKGNPSKMTNMNKGLTFTTTIPCEYYPGYETISKI